MSHNSPNPYNQPQSYSLKILDKVWDSDGYEEEQILVVWRHTTTGQLYWATEYNNRDYMNWNPFEEVTGLSQLSLLDRDHLAEFERGVQKFITTAFNPSVATRDTELLLERVSQLLER